MSDNDVNRSLSGLLIELNKSLLQYVGECWPWSSNNDSVRGTVEELVARQQQSVSAIANSLIERGATLESGGYPTEYTSLHYVSLQFLLDELCSAQKGLVERTRTCLRAVGYDDSSRSLVESVLDNEKDVELRLCELASGLKSVTAG